MGSQNVELIKRLFELQAEGRFDEIAERYHPDAEVTPASDSGRTLRGGTALAEYLRGTARAGVEINPAALHFDEDGDGAVIVSGRIVITSAEGARADSPVAWRFELDEEGLVIRACGARSARPPA